MAQADPGPRILIVGAGFGGVAMAIELRKHGFSDITVLEGAPEPGGTWFHNSYPGAACDVPSPLYSFSFAQRTDWTHLCSPQPAILRYLQEVTRSFGIEPLIRFNSLVQDCTWDGDARQWTVRTADGAEHVGDALVIATGQLHQPVIPDLPGRDVFTGKQFHSARWDHDYDLTGKRVAVIGSGASAVQFVPEIAPKVARLTVFQRTGNWFLARRNRPYPFPIRWAIEHVPFVQPALRNFYYWYAELLTASIRHPRTLGKVVGLRSAAFMKRKVKDPELRRKIWPDHTFGCKRVLFSSHFLPALTRSNVDVVTEKITGLTETGVRTADGRVTDVDCVIWATGFATNDFMFPMEIRGRDGLDLREVWAKGAHAHLGITVPGFPSMFVLYGPNTNTSGGSIIWYLEQQAAYVRQALELVRDRNAAAIEVKPEVEAASDAALQRRFAGTAWLACDSWYRDSDGRIVANWPGYMRDYLAAVKEINGNDFELVS
ncbi:NAD(P)/FAD-dependent oxidoreductase [Sporichthya brevicatena]|uniref:NAD(P)/FAD-dependent oxidoreductase n=1 Tax=Sporichthya brevicatena TaxID=171442 RepID=A0ABN1GEX3_9ACTN